MSGKMRRMAYRRSARYNLGRKYRLSLGVFEEMLVAQAGRCAVYGVQMIGRAEPAVDHNHETEAVRGLLCTNCNRALERLDSVPGWAIRAEEYCKNPPAAAVVGRETARLGVA